MTSESVKAYAFQVSPPEDYGNEEETARLLLSPPSGKRAINDDEANFWYKDVWQVSI